MRNARPGPSADLRRLLSGRPLALPRMLDALSERWSRLPGRARMLFGVVLVVALGTVLQQRAAQAEGQWGGDPVPVLRATRYLPPGGPVEGLEEVRLPPLAVPARPVDAVPDGAVLALALPAGSVLTQAHLDPHGPAAGLAPDRRAVPVPVEAGWRVEPGGWVDVWVLGAGDDPARLVARSRPVLQVLEDQGSLTALVAFHADEVASVTGGLALGTILLAHAPPPLGEEGAQRPTVGGEPRGEEGAQHPTVGGEPMVSAATEQPTATIRASPIAEAS